MKLRLTLVALLCLLPPQRVLACDGIEFSGVWVREPPPGARGTAAYFKVSNAGSQPAVLDAWSSPAFAHVMLHETVVTGDKAEMRHRAGLELAAGGAAELSPGGLHLMLMQPGTAIAAGQVIAVDYRCNGQPAQFSAPVQQEAPSRL